MQLFCFTFAGGTAAFFNQLEDASNREIEFIKLEYSGHGIRINEKLCTDFKQIAEDLYPIIKDKYKGGEYGLLGYSMGTLSAIEIYRYIEKTKEMPVPKHIFIAAHTPSVMIEFDKVSGDSIDRMVKQRTIDFGAVPDKLINNNSFWRIYLPIYKADYLMISKYSLEGLTFNKDVPLTVFYSEMDTPISLMKAWRDYFNCVEYIQYDGSHFFINEHYREMSEIIKKRLGIEK